MISAGAVGTENSKEIEVGDGNRVNGRGNVKTVALELRSSLCWRQINKTRANLSTIKTTILRQ
jgi:hypothetical protein